MATMKATDPYVRQWWDCAALLVANGVCAPDLNAISDVDAQRKEVAKYVGLLAKELLTVAGNAPAMTVDLG